MKALIDGDILRYEIGFAAETGWQKDECPPWDYVANLLTRRIQNICAETEVNEHQLYISGAGNFRDEIGKKKKYKGTRVDKKPYHFKNLSAYIKGVLDPNISEGIEADDVMAIEQTTNPEGTIICSRDKDLRQVPGWHYSWEIGKQARIGPIKVDKMGFIEYIPEKKKLFGTGLSFFYAQVLLGDTVDNVPGLPKFGPVAAFKHLSQAKTPADLYGITADLYKQVYKEKWEEELLEQGRLLWLVRRLDNGKPVMWELGMED